MLNLIAFHGSQITVICINSFIPHTNSIKRNYFTDEKTKTYRFSDFPVVIQQKQEN